MTTNTLELPYNYLKNTKNFHSVKPTITNLADIMPL
jgi:hypothetical protein